MTTLTKVYTLPDLPSASTSNLQLLVRRLMEYADLSTLPAIADELREQQRYVDLEKFQYLFSDWCGRLTNRNENWAVVRWKWVGESLLNLFFVDLFGWQAVSTLFVDKIRFEDEIFEDPDHPPTMAENRLFIATDTIEEGSYGVLNYNTSIIRMATPEEIAQHNQPPQEEAAL